MHPHKCPLFNRTMEAFSAKTLHKSHNDVEVLNCSSIIIPLEKITSTGNTSFGFRNAFHGRFGTQRAKKPQCHIPSSTIMRLVRASRAKSPLSVENSDQDPTDQRRHFLLTQAVANYDRVEVFHRPPWSALKGVSG